uniref:G-protein coupled receptors family 3 profile domain-containing protein n=1 Tax=Paramormyrops kingsleyae TaxID=1676925 RepID=A0A3B3S8T5_9TELE
GPGQCTVSMLLLLGLLLIGPPAQAEDSKCTLLGRAQLPELSKDGDMLIGGIFSFHTGQEADIQSFTTIPKPLPCKNVNFREFQFALTMIFAIEEINRNSEILPHAFLGYKIYNDCGTSNIMRAALALVNGQDQAIHSNNCTQPDTVQAIIGHSGSTPTIGFATVIGRFHIPVVSHFATCACLSNRKEFPTFFRTIPSDYYQSRALAQLVKHFGWTWVGAVSSNNDYGINGIATFMQVAQQEGVCVEYSEAFDSTGPYSVLLRIVSVIKRSTSKVIMAFMTHREIKVLVEETERQNITDIQWIGSDAWITDTSLTNSKGNKALVGAIGFVVSKAQIPGLQNYLQRLHPSHFPQSSFVREFWEIVFNCTLATGSKKYQKRPCNGSENLENVQNQFTDVSDLRFTNNVYKAVYAVAHALHNLYTYEHGYGFDSSSTLPPWKVLHYLQTVNFTLETGEEVLFDSNGDSPARYDLINLQNVDESTMQVATIGYYDASLPQGQQFIMNNTNIVWGGGSKEVPVSVCSESCPPGTRKAVQKGKPVCCYDCVPCAEGEISNATDCIKCQSEYWSNIRRDACVLKEIEFLSYGDLMGLLLALFSLIGAFFTTGVGLIFYYHRHTPIVRANNTELSFLLLFSLTLCFLCSLTFIAVGFWAVLGYIGLLSALCFVLAFLARKLPDNFNEAKFITFSMLIFCAVWITFIPAYVSSPGKFTVAVEIFAILASSSGLLFCNFIPKCYFIIFKPEKNTKKALMGKASK